MLDRAARAGRAGGAAGHRAGRDRRRAAGHRRRCRSPICAPGWRRCIPSPGRPTAPPPPPRCAAGSSRARAVVYLADGLTDGADFAALRRGAARDAGAVTEICCDAAPGPPAAAAATARPTGWSRGWRRRRSRSPTQAAVLAQSGDGRTLARAAIAPAGRRRRRRRAASCCRRSCATGWPAGAGRPALRRLRRAAGRALAPAAGRAAGRRPDHRRHAVLRPAVSTCAARWRRSPSCARPTSATLLQRDLSVLVLADRPLPAGPERDAVTAMGREGRAADPLRRPAHRRAADRRDRSAAAGAAAGRRPAAGRRAVLERAGRPGAVPRRLAVRRAGRARRGEGQPPGAGRARAPISPPTPGRRWPTARRW